VIMERQGKTRSFRHQQDGIVSVLLVILLPLLILVAGIAIDLSSIAAQKRYVQGQADLGALTAIRHFDTASGMRTAARKTIEKNDRYPTLPILDSQIEIGTARRADFEAAGDQSSLVGNNAVRVTVRSKAVLYILPLFTRADEASVARVAVASQSPRVSFALSNCLLSLNLLRPLLQPLMGAQVDVLCSGRGIDTQISGQGLLQSLQSSAHILTPSGSEATYGDILDANLPVSSVLGSAFGIPIANTGESIRLKDVMYLAPDLRSLRISQPLPPMNLNAADIAFASAELLGKRVATVQTGLSLPSIGTVQAKVTVGDPRQIVLGAVPGDPDAIARTSQIRVELPAVKIANLFNLTLELNVANASAKLSDEGATCSENPSTVVAVFDPVTASLLDLDLRVEVLGLPFNLSSLGKVADSLVSREQRKETFTREQATHSPVKTFGPELAPDLDALSRNIQATVSHMLTTASGQMSLQAGPVTSCTNPLGCLVNTTLSTTAVLLRSLIGQVNTAASNVIQATGLEGTATHGLVRDFVGLSVAQAKLQLLDAGCEGRARLVQ
jgi:Flp pilus assembly protein TadG